MNRLPVEAGALLDDWPTAEPDEPLKILVHRLQEPEPAKPPVPRSTPTREPFGTD